MPGLAIILAEPNLPGLAEQLDHMLAPLTYGGYVTPRAVFPELGVAAGCAGPERCARPQPGKAEGGRYTAILEGELPDAPALIGRLGLAPDTPPASVLAATFAREGEAGLTALTGHWAACIIDRTAGRVTVANDAFGVRPLYYAHVEGGAWLIASHAAALLAHRGIPRALDPAGMADYLAFGHCIGAKTLFRGIAALPGATLLSWRAGELTVRRYWKPSLRPEARSSEADLEAIRCMFDESVARLVAVSRPSSLALTGGGDSRAILAAMVGDGAGPHTVTHSIPGATDAVLAAQVAAKAGAEQHFYEVRGEIVLPQIVPGIRLLGGRVAGIDVHPLCFLDDFTRYTRAMFTGLGGNLFKGNDYIDIPGGEREIDTLPALTQWLLTRYNRYLSVDGDFSALLTDDWLAQMQPVPENSVRDALDAAGPETEMYRRSGIFYLEERVCKYLTKGDAIVRREIETRHPFMHRGLLEATWRLPAAVRDAGLVESYIITRDAPALARMPFAWEYGDGLPLRPYASSELGRRLTILSQRWYVKREELGWNKKRQVGNYRWAEWLRGPLKSILHDVLLDPQTQHRPYFRGETLKGWLDEHMAGQDRTLKLTTLLSLELTVRDMIDRAPGAPTGEAR
jgi:asparagine synthetase B (glutamine-hydrolysing)